MTDYKKLKDYAGQKYKSWLHSKEAFCPLCDGDVAYSYLSFHRANHWSVIDHCPLCGYFSIVEIDDRERRYERFLEVEPEMNMPM